MLQLRVHRFSVPLIRAYHDSIPIQITRSSTLYPLLTSSPRIVETTSLQATISISGPAHILASIKRDAGYTIYRAHIDMLMIWMYGHHMKGSEVYSAMVEFYDLYGITEDDMPFATAYKIWQRWFLKKKSKNSLTFSGDSV